MTPKEKSLELVDRFINVEYLIDFQDMTLELAKQCALIAVDEIFKTNTLEDRNCGFVTLCEKHKEYWEEVKQEIEKI